MTQGNQIKQGVVQKTGMAEGNFDDVCLEYFEKDVEWDWLVMHNQCLIRSTLKEEGRRCPKTRFYLIFQGILSKMKLTGTPQDKHKMNKEKESIGVAGGKGARRRAEREWVSWWLLYKSYPSFKILQQIIALQGKMSQSSAILECSFSSAFDLKSQTSTEGEDIDFRREMLTCAGHTLPFRTACSKAKSSLCKNFMEKGFCPYGAKCQFAHGPQELRINMEHNRSYKTKGCHAFAKKGYCCYGSRCNFIHEQTSTLPTGPQKWQAIYGNHRATFQEMQEEGSSRLMRMLNARI